MNESSTTIKDIAYQLAILHIFELHDDEGECPKTYFGIDWPECTNNNLFCQQDHQDCWYTYFLNEAKKELKQK